MPPPPKPVGASTPIKSQASSSSFASPVASPVQSTAKSISSSNSTAFSVRTQDVIRKVNGSCFGCSATSATQIAHVIGQRDSQLEIWLERNLLSSDFAINSYLNGITLCGRCHDNFDAAGDPGFTIIPEDLDFFIKFELDDLERRKKLVQNGVMPSRKAPTHGDYKDDQVAKGVIGRDDAGGRYLPIILKPDFHPGFSDEYNQEYLRVRSQPRVWQGDPMAALRRSFPVLSSPRLQIIPEEVWWKLHKLFFLYFLEDRDPGSTTGRAKDGDSADDDDSAEDSNDPQPHDQPAPKRDPPTSKRDRPADDEDNSMRKKLRKSPASGSTQQKPNMLLSNCDFGPSCTAQDMITLFTPYFRGSQ